MPTPSLIRLIRDSRGADHAPHDGHSRRPSVGPACEVDGLAELAARNRSDALLRRGPRFRLYAIAVSPSAASARAKSSVSTRRNSFTAAKEEPSPRTTTALAERLRLSPQLWIFRLRLGDGDRHQRQDERAVAAVGLTSLDHKGTIIAANRANYEAYRRGFSNLAGIKLFPFDPRETSNFQYLVVEVDERAAGLSRDELAAVLAAENVLARRVFLSGLPSHGGLPTARGARHRRYR